MLQVIGAGFGRTGTTSTKAALEILLKDPQVDAVLVVHSPTATVDSREVANAIAPLARAASRPILSCWLGGASVLEARTIAANNIVNSGLMVAATLVLTVAVQAGVTVADSLLIVAGASIVAAWLGWKLHLACD